MRYITEGVNSHNEWANAEVRVYTFAVEEDQDVDGEAWVVPVKDAKVIKEGVDGLTSSDFRN